ncbi:tetratricopeptide (TPR) repeat protein [Bradyrhizobium sp. USDA 4354]
MQKFVAIWAAIAAMAFTCSGAPADTDSRIHTEVKQAERAGAFDRAIELLSTAISNGSISNAERRNILKQRAYLYERIGQTDRAVVDWSSAIAIEPVDPALYASRGFFYLRLHRYDNAIANFSKGETLDPKSPIFAYGLGEMESDRGNYEEAIKSYTKALSLAPDHATALLGRGEAYLAKKSYRNAQLDFEHVLRSGHVLLPGTRGRVYLGLGFAKMRAGEFAKAISDLDQGLEVLPNDLSGLRARAFALQKLGDRKRSLEDYERILTLQPDDSWAAEQVGKLKVR